MMRKDLFKALTISTLIILLVESGNLNSEERISWAGLSYISQANEIESLYPFSKSLERKIQPLLREITLKQDKDYELITSELVNSDLGDNKTIVVALDKERITGGKLGKYCFWEYTISAQVILYDSESQNILSIFPVGKRRPYVEESKECSSKTRDKKRDKFRFCQIYLGLETDENFSDEEFNTNCLEVTKDKVRGGFINDIASAVSKISIKEKNNIRFVGIGEVDVQTAALDILSGKKEHSAHPFYRNKDLAFDRVGYENSIGQIFAKSLSSRLDIPIVPPLKGKAIGGSIPLSFSDSSKVANLKLPELDYSFDIKIRGFKKVKLDETALREAWVYGSYLTISFGLEGMHDQSSKIKNGYVVEKVKSDDLNDWQQFDYSTEIILKEFTDSISKPNKKWVKEKTNLSFKEAKSYFSYVKEKLDSAR
jgi:hypothetical protein